MGRSKGDKNILILIVVTAAQLQIRSKPLNSALEVGELSGVNYFSINLFLKNEITVIVFILKNIRNPNGQFIFQLCMLECLRETVDLFLLTLSLSELTYFHMSKK